MDTPKKHMVLTELAIYLLIKVRVGRVFLIENFCGWLESKLFVGEYVKKIGGHLKCMMHINCFLEIPMQKSILYIQLMKTPRFR
jgi:hypothetical protein